MSAVDVRRSGRSGHTDDMHPAWSASVAGRAAGARATECHTRLVALREATRATTEADVAHAHEALLRAAFRAALAEERSAAALRRTTKATPPGDVRHGGPHDHLGGSSASMGEHEAGTYDLQHERMAMLGIAVDELWIHYAALCGTYSRRELQAYLDGALELSATERVRIDQALWELGDSG
jgi:hypothetical protein